MKILGDITAAERRQIVAHSASCGLAALFGTSSGGAAEDRCSSTGFLSPLPGLKHFSPFPMVGTMGYYRPLLRS